MSFKRSPPDPRPMARLGRPPPGATTIQASGSPKPAPTEVGQWIRSSTIIKDDEILSKAAAGGIIEHELTNCDPGGRRELALGVAKSTIEGSGEGDRVAVIEY